MRITSLGLFSLLALTVTACPSDPVTTDAGGEDAGPTEIDTGVRVDAGPRDAGVRVDAGSEIDCTGADCAIVEVVPMGSSTCARRMNGDVICWGRGREAALGDGRMVHAPGCMITEEPEPVDCSSSPVLVDLDEPALELAAGASEICAVVGAGREHYCWGEGDFNVGTTLPTRNFAPTPFSILMGNRLSTANNFWCWLDASGDPFCMGHNSVGMLGNNSLVDSLVPTPIVVAGTPTTPLADETILELEVGVYSGTACARTADTVYCWGDNKNGNLGDGNDTHQDCAGGTALADCSPAAVPVTIDATLVADLTIGNDHACALMSDGTVMCWGGNAVSQLGLGDQATRDVPTLVPGIDDAIAIDAMGGTTCVLHDGGTISCWGVSDVGQIGDGMTSHTAGVCGGTSLVDCQPTPALVMGIDDATSIRLGFGHACTIRESGEVWCWGENRYYELGDGTRMTRHAPVRVPFLP